MSIIVAVGIYLGGMCLLIGVTLGIVAVVCEKISNLMKRKDDK